jgi:hypothetical protein
MNPDVEAAQLELLLHLDDSMYLVQMVQMVHLMAQNLQDELENYFQILAESVLDHLNPDAVEFHQDGLDQLAVAEVVLDLHHFHPFYL